eukprot:scaffold748_cov329-Pavlova_lutheri.AAC.20
MGRWRGVIRIPLLVVLQQVLGNACFGEVTSLGRLLGVIEWPLPCAFGKLLQDIIIVSDDLHEAASAQYTPVSIIRRSRDILCSELALRKGGRAQEAERWRLCGHYTAGVLEHIVHLLSFLVERERLDLLHRSKHGGNAAG